ncbi:MAG: hypothetical protein K2K34_06825, partial [Oscillospiraceae bacterium]|nr:hypothetical protein [Oscillospiraceae bacterium]
TMDNSINTNGIFSKISGEYINKNKIEEESDATNSYMSFDSYLKLIVAQMKNQDFNNPMDDSEVLAQMAQYSMLEGIKNMTQQSSISYASSLVGKVVTVDDGTGSYTGMVESVTVKNGTPYLMVDGMSYKSDKVTDIVQEDIYNLMLNLIGHKVKSKNSESENAVTGTVTNVVYKDGEAYVVVNEKLYSLDSIVLADEGNEGTGDAEGSEGEGTEGVEGAEGSENVSGTEGEEGTEKDSGADDSGETITETAEAETSAAMSYKARSESLIDTFMKELDEAGGVAEVSEASAANAASSATEEYYVEIMEVEVPDYSAGVYADNNVITGTISSNSDTVMGSGSGTLSRSYDSETVNNSYSYDNYNFNYSGSGLRGVTTEKGVSTRDCVPHRISVEAYPEEAALADRLGTRMYDIRFINNRAITSRIKTGEVIGHSSSGKPVTEIGYSGVGQLGEVITFADGTQRVEILMKNGNSGWLTTSGRLTLDEICTRNGAPGSLAGKLTPEESAIRHFSDPMANVDPSRKNSFQSYVSRYGV